MCVTSHHSRQSPNYNYDGWFSIIGSFDLETICRKYYCWSQIMLHCKPDRYWKITWYLQFFMVSCSLLFSRLTSSVQKFSLSFRPFRYERLGSPFLIRFLAFHSVVRTDIERNVSCKRSQFIPWQYSQIAPYGHSPQPTALLICTAVFSKSPLNSRKQKLSLLGAISIYAFVDTFLAP